MSTHISLEELEEYSRALENQLRHKDIVIQALQDMNAHLKNKVEHERIRNAVLKDVIEKSLRLKIPE